MYFHFVNIAFLLYFYGRLYALRARSSDAYFQVICQMASSFPLRRDTRTVALAKKATMSCHVSGGMSRVGGCICWLLLQPFDADFFRLCDVEPPRFRLRPWMLDRLPGESQITTPFIFHSPQPARASCVGLH